jgi:pSer/pThr/pTyr-binding forkhead associated (FHA) protein
MGEPPAAPTAPDLILETDGGSTLMNPGRVYHVGRDPLSEIVLDDARVSWHHAVLRSEAGRWTIEDENSTNGTYTEGQRIHESGIGPGTVVRFGNPADGPRAMFTGLLPEPAPARPATKAGYGRPSAVSMPSATRTFHRPTTVRPLPTRTVHIGRAEDNDLVVDDLIVSRRHAELRHLADGTYEIVDVGSHNGTYLNGQRIERAQISPGDIVGIGHSAFCLVGDELQEFVDSGEVSLDVQDLTVSVDGGRKILLDHVSFPVGEKCLLAVVGPSGAGKSTLLNALTGLRPADHGTVLYDGRDLYRDYAELRQRIGLVPQDDILHLQLTVRGALGYAAELRFPGDSTPEERETRVEEVIRELGLEERA